MPRELVDFAHANGCTPINDIFERPGMVNPPFVYAWLPGNPADSAAFWCKKTEKSAKPYKLLFKVYDPKQMAGCPTTAYSGARRAPTRSHRERQLEVIMSGIPE
jgi:hypothetical protein